MMWSKSMRAISSRELFAFVQSVAVSALLSGCGGGGGGGAPRPINGDTQAVHGSEDGIHAAFNAAGDGLAVWCSFSGSDYGSTKVLCARYSASQKRWAAEVELGTFDNTLSLGLKSFSDFPGATPALPEALKDRPIVTFCTGGIRCEKAAPWLIRQGFRDVYQLDGGILNYFEQCGSAHFRGACFVFDERVALDPGLHATAGATGSDA